MSFIPLLIVGSGVVGAIVAAALIIKAIIVAGSTVERAIDETSREGR